MAIKINVPKQRGSILAILEPHFEATRLLRLAKRKSRQLGLKWEVLYVETPESKREFNLREQENILNSLTLAEQMGAKFHKVAAKTYFEGVQQFLKQREGSDEPIRTIFIGKVKKSRFSINFRKTLVEKLVAEYAGKHNLVVVRLGVEVNAYKRYTNILRVNSREILLSLIAAFSATLFIEVLNTFIPEIIDEHNRNKSIIYMVACAFAAGRYGFLAGIIAALASYLSLNLLYVEPRFTVVLQDTADAANLFLFLAAGVILSLFSSKDYGDRHSLLKSIERFEYLLKVHRIALSGDDYIEVVAALDRELGNLLKTDIVFFFPSMIDNNELYTLLQDEVSMSEGEKEALNICWSECEITGVGAPINPEGCKWRFVPLMTSNNELGVMAVHITKKIELDVEFGRLLAGIADQVALIIERLNIEYLAEETRVTAEKEQLRAMLLSSVSHDLKTPLASVIGALSAFRSMRARLSEEQASTLITTALDEAQRLDSFITNILDMTRIESGQIELNIEWIKPDDLVKDCLKRLKERLRSHVVIYEPPASKYEVAMDYIMTGQVLQNLLDNAVKYTGVGSKIEILWSADKNGFVLSVRDNGNGIPTSQLEKVFDKYTRLKKQDHQVAGTGLGLAIAKAVVETQSGNIKVKNHTEGGVVFTISLPKTRKIKDNQ